MSGAGRRRGTLPLSVLALAVVALPLALEVGVPLHGQAGPTTAVPLPAAGPAVDVPVTPEEPSDASDAASIASDIPSPDDEGPSLPPGIEVSPEASPSNPAMGGPSPAGPSAVGPSPSGPAVGGPSPAGPTAKTPSVRPSAAPPPPLVGVTTLVFAQDTLLDPEATGHVTGPRPTVVTAQRLEGGVWRDRASAPVAPDGGYRVSLGAGHGELRSDRWRIVAAGTPGPEINVQRLGELRPVVRRATRADVAHSWQEGCPVPWTSLVVLDANHYGFDGRMHRGTIVLRDIHQQKFAELLQYAIDVRFPIRKMQTLESYQGDDDASAADDNTSGFNCRRTPLGTYWSEHARGAAIDINPVENPYNKAGRIIPVAGAAYLDRTSKRPGMLTPDSPLIRYAEANHWLWLNPSDYQHLEQPSPPDP